MIPLSSWRSAAAEAGDRLPESRPLILTSDDYFGHRLVRVLERQSPPVWICYDATAVSPWRMLHLIRRRRLRLRHVFQMAHAAICRPRMPRPDHPRIRTNAELLDKLRQLSPTAVYCYRAGLILSREVLDEGIPCFNIHCAKLPEYAGLAAICRALEAGDYQQEAVLHRMTVRIDVGAALRRELYFLNPDLSYQENEKKAFTAGLRLLLRTLTQT